MLLRCVLNLQCFGNLTFGIGNIVAVNYSVINIGQRNENLGGVQRLQLQLIFIRLHTAKVKISGSGIGFNFHPAQLLQNPHRPLLVHRVIRYCDNRAVLHLKSRPNSPRKQTKIARFMFH
ncbi:hypothetical protein D3C87_1691860 [compost metagenome]